MSRTIKPALVAIFDERLKTNTLAKFCIENKRPRQLFVEAAKSFLGVHEIPPNRGLEVELIQKTVQLNAGDSWCMAFMQSCIAYAEEKTGIISPIYADGLCTAVWDKTLKEQRVKIQPLAGAIAIWQHLDNPIHGHTGMVLDCDGNSFHAVEGNTSSGWDDINAKVGQIGDGVGFTHRRYDLFQPYYGDMKLLGCLKPF